MKNVLLVFDPKRPVGYESRKLYANRWTTGFWQAFITGPRCLDVGYRGGTDAVPIFPNFTGVELDTAGYDGTTLPYPAGSIDCVHASHVLEHVADARSSLWSWHQVLRIGGTLIIMVPHAYLYERRVTVPPSRWSPEHVRGFTPATLLKLVEETLPPNTYRIRRLVDRDDSYEYGLPITAHPRGALEIELVIKRIAPPLWQVEP